MKGDAAKEVASDHGLCESEAVASRAGLRTVQLQVTRSVVIATHAWRTRWHSKLGCCGPVTHNTCVVRLIAWEVQS